MASRTDVDDLLRGYDPPTHAQVKRWWQSAHVAVDANVLLNLYRYSAETRTQLLAVLRAMDERLWIPRRAAEEFARNRLSVLATQRTAQAKIASLFDRLSAEASDALRKISDELSRRQGAPSHDERAVEAFKHLRDALLQEEQERFGSASDPRKDPLLAEVKKLLKERMGSGLTEEQLDAVIKEGPKRYANGIPPGYEDAGKGNTDQYGDLVIWHEILERSRIVKQPVIFVTDDAKKDWLYQVSGQTIGPNPLLVRELWDAAGVPLLIYDTARFVDQANRELDLATSVSEEAIEEVRNTPLRRMHYLPSWNDIVKGDLPVASTRKPLLDPESLRQLRDLLSSSTSPREITAAQMRDLLRDRPLATCIVTEGTATLTLSNVPRGSEVKCSVTEPDGAIRTIEHATTDSPDLTLTFVYPDDFGAPAMVPGVRQVAWYQSRGDGSVTLLTETSFAND